MKRESAGRTDRRAAALGEMAGAFGAGGMLDVMDYSRRVL